MHGHKMPGTATKYSMANILKFPADENERLRQRIVALLPRIDDEATLNWMLFVAEGDPNGPTDEEFWNDTDIVEDEEEYIQEPKKKRAKKTP